MENPVTQGQGSEKVVNMPTVEEMTKKLEENRLLGGEPIINSFLGKFVGRVANSRKAGTDLNMAWELAKYGSFQSYSPMIAALADMNYDAVIDAVTPDPEVATQAKDFHKMVLEELKKKG